MMQAAPLFRARRGWLALGVLVAAVSCAHWGARTAPEPAITSLLVHNRSLFDVNVYVLPSPVARPIRLGTVVSTSEATFPIRTRDLQPGGLLTVQVHAIGAVGSWTSDAMALSAEEEIAVLDVNANSFGDCSTSMFYRVAKSDTAASRHH